jgi:hypothetical protein
MAIEAKSLKLIKVGTEHVDPALGNPSSEIIDRVEQGASTAVEELGLEIS